MKYAEWVSFVVSEECVVLLGIQPGYLVLQTWPITCRARLPVQGIMSFIEWDLNLWIIFLQSWRKWVFALNIKGGSAKIKTAGNNGNTGRERRNTIPVRSIWHYSGDSCCSKHLVNILRRKSRSRLSFLCVIANSHAGQFVCSAAP